MNNENKNIINWFPGHMMKTKREIVEKLNLIDIVYEVIDARMPISSKIIDLDELIKDKKRIVVFTKYDLCDKEKTNYYINKLKYPYLVLDLKNANNNDIKILMKIEKRKV